jgi:hypothetical protein
MKTTFVNHKTSLLLLTLIFIGLSTVLVSCDGVSTDTKDKIMNEAQDLKDKFSQAINQLLPQLQTELKQASTQLSPPIATVEDIWADFSSYPMGDVLSIRLKPTTIAIADKQYAADLYEKGAFRERKFVSWNQPELNVLKEKLVNFPISQKEYDAYLGEYVGHIFSVKVHE